VKAFYDHLRISPGYAFALTAHRSQGGTFDNVFVSYRDIVLERHKCLYVALPEEDLLFICVGSAAHDFNYRC